MEYELKLTREELWAVDIALSAQKVELLKSMNPVEDYEQYLETGAEYDKVCALEDRVWKMLETYITNSLEG